MIGRPPEDWTGKKFGTRTVLGPVIPREQRVTWWVKCDCGHVHKSLSQGLKRHGACQMCAHKGERPNRRKRPYESQYNNFVKRARFPVSISYEQYAELAKQKSCHYCGTEVFWSEYRRAGIGGNGSNLDRKDYRIGYTLENVAVCCGRCNYAKGTHFSYGEWLEIGKLIKSWNRKQTQPITPLSSKHKIEQDHAKPHA